MERLIRSMKSAELTAECPSCGETFSMSDAILFDGTKPFPLEAVARRDEYEQELIDSHDDLKKKKDRATKAAARTAEAVNIGKMIEHIVPVLEGFRYETADCRALFDPIDVIIFKGLTQSKVNHITFLEIKTGKARLNTHQKMVFDAIDRERVFFEEV